MSNDKPTGKKISSVIIYQENSPRGYTGERLGIWHLLAWFQIALVVFHFPGLDDGMEGILTISRHSGGLLRTSMGTHEGSQAGARPFAAFWHVQTGQQTGRLAPTGISCGQHPWKRCDCRQTQVSSLLVLLLCFSMKKFFWCSWWRQEWGARTNQHFHGDAHLAMKWELLLHGDLRMMHRAGKVHCSYGQCFPVKGYESFWSVLAARARLFLKLDIYPEMLSANTPYSHLLVVELP